MNERIEQERFSTVASLVSRPDVITVGTVSTLDASVPAKRSLLGVRSVEASTVCHQCYKTQSKAESMNQCLNAYQITCQYSASASLRNR